MKRIIVLLCIVSSFDLHSQISTRATSPDFDLKPFDVKIKKNGVLSSAYTNNVPAGVIADAIKKFGESAPISWSLDEESISGYFHNDNEYVTVYYKRNGRHILTRKVYDSSRLDADLKTFLEQEVGKAFTVNLITEVTKEGGKVYEISLISQKQICVVQIFIRKGDENIRLVEKTFMTRGNRNAQ